MLNIKIFQKISSHVTKKWEKKLIYCLHNSFFVLVIVVSFRNIHVKKKWLTKILRVFRLEFLKFHFFGGFWVKLGNVGI